MMYEDINRRRLLKGIGLGTGIMALPSTASAAQRKEKKGETESTDMGDFALPEEPQDPESVNPGTRWSDRLSAVGSDTQENGFGNTSAIVGTSSETMTTFAAGAGASLNPGAASVIYSDFELADFHDDNVASSLVVSFDYTWESDICDPGLSEDEEKSDEERAEKKEKLDEQARAEAEDEQVDKNQTDDVVDPLAPPVLIPVATFIGTEILLLSGDGNAAMTAGIIESNANGEFTNSDPQVLDDPYKYENTTWTCSFEEENGIAEFQHSNYSLDPDRTYRLYAAQAVSVTALGLSVANSEVSSDITFEVA